MYTQKKVRSHKIIILLVILFSVGAVIGILIYTDIINFNKGNISTDFIDKLFDFSGQRQQNLPHFNPDPPMFSDKKYIDLKFHTSALPVEVGAKGRDNPFEPFAYMLDYLTRQQESGQTQNQSENTAENQEATQNTNENVNVNTENQGQSSEEQNQTEPQGEENNQTTENMGKK